MKNSALLVLAFVSCSVLSLGCGGGPSVSTEEDAQQSMDASMEVDTMAETTSAPASGGETTTP